MLPFQPGAALIALRTNATVVPVGITGTHGMLPYGTVWPKHAPRPVQIRYGTPIRYDDIKEKDRHEALQELTQRMETAVAELAEQPLLSPQPEER
jgi:1-acyl-sn-glycerol-3-phosphate acyltransferase